MPLGKLELTVKEKTEGRDRVEKEQREKENRLTQAETNRDNAESHRAACLKKFEDRTADVLDSVDRRRIRLTRGT